MSIIESINTEHGTFTSNEETGKTAEEAYNEYLENLNKTVIIEPTIADLQAQIFNLTSQLVNGGVL